MPALLTPFSVPGVALVHTLLATVTTVDLIGTVRVIFVLAPRVCTNANPMASGCGIKPQHHPKRFDE